MKRLVKNCSAFKVSSKRRKKAVAARHDEQLQLVGQVEKFRVELQTLNGELTKTGELVTT